MLIFQTFLLSYFLRRNILYKYPPDPTYFHTNPCSNLLYRACKTKKELKETGIQADLCGHGAVEEKAGSDKDNSMEAILLTTQLKEEVLWTTMITIDDTLLTVKLLHWSS